MLCFVKVFVGKEEEGKEIEGYAAVMWLVIRKGMRRLCTFLCAKCERVRKGRVSC